MNLIAMAILQKATYYRLIQHTLIKRKARDAVSMGASRFICYIIDLRDLSQSENVS